MDTTSKPETAWAPGEAAARILRLAWQLRGKGYQPDIADDELWALTIWRPPEDPVRVECRPRGSDGGRLWFFFPPNIPISEADGDHDADAMITICDRADPRS